jgi:hypothetical protein
MMDEPTPHDIAQEHELHQLIVASLDRFPEQMKREPELNVLAWAHELRIHDSGRRDYADGYADLLTVDELGLTWIIEVKLATSAELNARVWEQLIRYRDGLKSMEWKAIHQYLDRFLGGEGTVKPISTRFKGQPSLSHVIGAWQSLLHRELISANEIVASIAQALNHGTAGLAVIADGYVSSIVEGATGLLHDGPVAYLTAMPSDAGLLYTARYVRRSPNSNEFVPREPIESALFDRYAAQKTAKLTTADFAERLNPCVVPLWEEVVKPSLLRLGWDGTPYKAERKGITICLPCRGGTAPLVRFAYSDTDSSHIPREFKLPGTYGLRVDLAARHLTRSGVLTRTEVEDLARRLYALGWRGTGIARDAGIRNLNETEYTKWGYMRYCPSPAEKDFLGRKGEDRALQSFFAEIQQYCGGNTDVPKKT